MKRPVLLYCILLFANVANAQLYTLSGTIRVYRDLSPLPGARVWSEGRPDTAISNANGGFSLPLINGMHTVHFNKVGFCEFVRPILISGSDVELAVELQDPRFNCNVTSIYVMSWPGHDGTATFELSNLDGDCPLEFLIADTSDWLSVTPDSSSVAPDSLMVITVNMNASVGPGEFLSVLRIDHNGLDSPRIIPVTFYIIWVEAEPPATAPEAFTLSISPNPFNPATTISFSLSRMQKVELTVYDITGHRVAILCREVLAPGMHKISFDGSGLPAGLYFAHLTGESFQKTQKLVLLR